MAHQVTSSLATLAASSFGALEQPVGRALAGDLGAWHTGVAAIQDALATELERVDREDLLVRVECNEWPGC